MGILDENVSLIASKLQEIQEASTFRNNVTFTADPEQAIYAQFMCGGDDDSSVYGELVSNVYLDPAFALSWGQAHDLLHRGWRLGHKNFEKTWLANNHDVRLRIAREIMSAFLDIYEVPMEARLSAEVHMGREVHPNAGADRLPINPETLPINIDADPRNADWIKTLSWDLPTDKDRFLLVIGGPDQLAHFMTLPAAEAMPKALREALGVDSEGANTGSSEVGDATEPPIDLSFRPETYWPEEDSLELRVARIKGERRRLRAEALLREGKARELEASIEKGMMSPNMSDEDREAWGRLDPSNLGGEFLPDPEPEEVEIARVAIASTTLDVASIRARRTIDGIAIRVVDEYESEFATGERVCEQTLTLGELVEVIDAADVVDADRPSGGLVFGTIRLWSESGQDDAELLNAAWASSAFYASLASYYERAIRDRTWESEGS